jgi:hypothetical protein
MDFLLARPQGRIGRAASDGFSDASAAREHRFRVTIFEEER